MGDIWRAPEGGLPSDAPGTWAVGDLNTDGNNPWGRTNPWAYDGAVYGYRELGDLGGSQYFMLGTQMNVCDTNPNSQTIYQGALDALNAGCNYPLTELTLGHVVDGADFTVNCTTDAGNAPSVIKASMAVWGVVRDVLTFNAPGEDQQMLSQAYGVADGVVFFTVTTPSHAAALQWEVWATEVIALWNA